MRNIKETELAMSVNNQTYIDYLDRLKLIATSLFTWENLDEIAGFGASDSLENYLYSYGKACFVKDRDLGFMILKANPSDKLNIYNLPEMINAWSIGYSKNYHLDDIVLIKNNKLMRPTVDSTQLFAYRLYEVQRTIDTNIQAQKTPVLIEGDPKARLTLMNLYEQYSGNIPFIFGNKDFNVNKHINVLKTDAPYLADKLRLEKHEIFNECLTYLGINNANTDKKERLITDEVESNNELINYYLNCFYLTRKQAEDMINNKFLKDNELKVKVKLNQDVLNMLDLTEEDIVNNNLNEEVNYE